MVVVTMAALAALIVFCELRSQARDKAIAKFLIASRKDADTNYAAVMKALRELKR